jgi:hypothetical protein
VLKEIEGTLAGEVLKINGAPDGRCHFLADNDQLTVLCYFKNGQKLKGPQLTHDLYKSQIEIRSKTWMANGHQAYTLALINTKSPGKTGYFVNKKLVKCVPFVERHTLDWLSEEQQTHEDLPVMFRGSYLG